MISPDNLKLHTNEYWFVASKLGLENYVKKIKFTKSQRITHVLYMNNIEIFGKRTKKN